MATTWLSALILGGWTLILAGYLVVCGLSLRPRPGTLEWIPQYNRRFAPLSRKLHPLGLSSGSYLCGITIALTAVRCIPLWPTVQTWSHQELVEVLFAVGQMFFLPAIAIGATFWLVYSLFGRHFLGFLGALLVAIDWLHPMSSLAVGVFVTALVVKMMFQQPEIQMWHNAPILVLIPLILAVATYFSPGLFFLYIPVILLIFVQSFHSFTSGHGFFRSFSSAFLILFSAYILATILVYIPAGIANGTDVFHAEFYQLLSRRWTENMVYALNSPWLFYGFFSILLHWGYYIFALCFMIPTAISALRHRNTVALLTLILGVASLAILLLTGVNITLLPVILSLCHTLGQLLDKRRYILLSIGIILSIITVFSLNISL